MAAFMLFSPLQIVGYHVMLETDMSRLDPSMIACIAGYVQAPPPHHGAPPPSYASQAPHQFAAAAPPQYGGGAPGHVPYMPPPVAQPSYPLSGLPQYGAPPSY